VSEGFFFQEEEAAIILSEITENSFKKFNFFLNH